MNVPEYVAEEVERQSHDLWLVDGIERVAWMLDAWLAAIELIKRGNGISVDDILLFGGLIEPVKNAGGFRQCGIRVTNSQRVFPKWDDVPRLIDALLEQQRVMSPLEFYKEFELIHPFRDGNGRTGKILLNWLNESMLAPVFPPPDLFGVPIENP